MLQLFHDSIVEIVEHSSYGILKSEKNASALIQGEIGNVVRICGYYLKMVGVCIAVAFHSLAVSSVREDPVIGVQSGLCCSRCC